MDREAWHAVIHGVAKSPTWLSDWTELNWTELQTIYIESNVNLTLETEVVSLVSEEAWVVIKTIKYSNFIFPHGLILNYYNY